MKFIVDAQLPPALADGLRSKGYDAVAVRNIGLRDADDHTIWARAVLDQAVIVTKDEDFIILATANPGGPQILWVRTGNLVNRLLITHFERVWPEIEAYLSKGIAVVEMR